MNINELIVKKEPIKLEEGFTCKPSAAYSDILKIIESTLTFCYDDNIVSPPIVEIYAFVKYAEAVTDLDFTKAFDSLASIAEIYDILQETSLSSFLETNKSYNRFREILEKTINAYSTYDQSLRGTLMTWNQEEKILTNDLGQLLTKIGDPEFLSKFEAIQKLGVPNG